MVNKQYTDNRSNNNKNNPQYLQCLKYSKRPPRHAVNNDILHLLLQVIGHMLRGGGLLLGLGLLTLVLRSKLRPKILLKLLLNKQS